MIIIYYFYSFLSGKIHNLTEKHYLLFFLVFFIFNFQIVAPENSLIFTSLWNNFEIFQNFRAFGRMNILMIPLMSVLICYSIKNLDNNTVNKKNYILFH